MIPVESITHVRHCDKAEQFLERILQPVHDLPYGGSTGLFRGHASDTWLLLPTALREDAFARIFEAGDLARPHVQFAQLLAEWTVFGGFVDVVDSIGLPVPDDSMAFRQSLESYPGLLFGGFDQTDQVVWPPRNFMAALALARHSGLPTRLLDWTRDPLNAAYFAAVEAAPLVISGEIPIDGGTCLSVWAIDHSRFNRRIDTGRDIGSMFDGKHVVPVEFFTVPSASNPNSHAQRGWFSVVRTSHELLEPIPREPLDAVIANVLSEEPAKPVFTKFTLPLKESPRLLYLLSQRNIRAASVFPDYRGAADTLRELPLRRLF